MSVLSPVIDYLDLATKHIYLLSGVREYHPVEDIYAEIRYLRKTTEAYRIFDIPVTAYGNIFKGGGKYTPRYARFNDGWTIVPEDVTHDLLVSGEQITDDGQSGKACMDLTALSVGVSVFIQYEPPAAEIVRDEVSLAAINFMSYSNMVTIDKDHGEAGTVYPAGNTRHPVNNIVDACTIADYYHITRLHFKHKGHVLDNDYDYTGFVLEGEAQATSSLHVESLPTLTAALIQKLTFSGIVDGGLAVLDCKVDGVTFFSGSMRECGVTAEPIILGGAGTATFNKCISLVAGGNARPQIDFNHEPTNLAIRGWEGGLEIVNKTNATGEVSIDISSGILYIRDTCTAGEITVRGLGRLVDESSAGCVVKYDGLLDPAYVQYLTYAEYIWIDEDSDNTGAVYPVGTPSKPLNNWADALALSSLLGIHQFMINGPSTIPATADIAGATIMGQHAVSSVVTIADGCTTGAATFKYMTLMGMLSPENGVIIEDAIIGNLSNVSGYMRRCALMDIMTLGGNRNTTLDMCFRGDKPIGTPPSIDMGGSGQSLGVRGWMGGGLTLSNLDDPDGRISVDFVTGRLDLAADLVQGSIWMRGTGELNDAGHTLTIMADELINKGTISRGVWDTAPEIATDVNTDEIADAVWSYTR